jgi:outer membrane lipoprotein
LISLNLSAGGSIFNSGLSGLGIWIMHKLQTTFIIIFALASMVSCSVISHQVRSEANPPVPFQTLIRDADKFLGQTVILGGYILETKNLQSQTILKVLQTPLRLGDDPDLKKRSQGRFMVYHKGFLDPEVYSKGQVITVAGRVIGTAVEKIGDEQIQYLKIENREIYLWSNYTNKPLYYYPWPYPHHRTLYPYWYWW